jgi:hypothetical protein
MNFPCRKFGPVLRRRRQWAIQKQGLLFGFTPFPYCTLILNSRSVFRSPCCNNLKEFFINCLKSGFHFDLLHDHFKSSMNFIIAMVLLKTLWDAGAAT